MDDTEEAQAEANAQDAAEAVKEEDEEAAELEDEVEEDQKHMNEEIYADEDDNLNEADFMPDEENDLSRLRCICWQKKHSDILSCFYQSTRVRATLVVTPRCEKLTRCKKLKNRRRHTCVGTRTCLHYFKPYFREHALTHQPVEGFPYIVSDKYKSTARGDQRQKARRT